MRSQDSRLDEMPGTAEEQTELYLTYCEGVPQAVTKQFAKSGGGVSGFAGKQADASGGLE